MKRIVLLLSVTVIIIFLINFSSPKYPSNFLSNQQTDEAEFLEYLSLYQKKYSGEEYYQRLKIFQDNISYIRLSNSLSKSYVLGINSFTDHTPEEFRLKYLQNLPKKSIASIFPSNNKSPLTYPPTFDWRAHGAVTPVKSQAPCACGYAFATTGAVEGAWKISGKPLVSLSEQQLLDCSDYFGNNGCNGGYVANSLSYVLKYGLTSEQDYHYTGRPTICNSENVAKVAARIKVYNHIGQNNPGDLLAAVAISPIAVDVEADSWFGYKSGILSVACVSRRFNYSALVVGYNTENKPPYYIVKTSFGTGFGEAGYILIAITPGEGSTCIQAQPIQVFSP